MEKEKMCRDRIVVVARTYMQQGICVSGLTKARNEGVRLRTANGNCLSEKTLFKIGQVWDIEYTRRGYITPPHVEDICVHKERYVGKQENLHDVLLERIQPWQGGPEALFGGSLVLHNKTAYIGREKPLPATSTGYWLSDRPLTLVYRRDRPYYWLPCDTSDGQEQIDSPDSVFQSRLYIRYVGQQPTLTHIPARTLLRVSLARWWVPPEIDEERCYLQLSGWYLRANSIQAPVSNSSVHDLLTE